jgi:hypothetical protein
VLRKKGKVLRKKGKVLRKKGKVLRKKGKVLRSRRTRGRRSLRPLRPSILSRLAACRRSCGHF